MDKLRALEYFVAAAEEGSLSGAARRFQVSIPAVAKLVNALEKRLGATLFDRGSQGLALTADGERYLDSCRPLLERLAEVDETVGGAAARARGEVVIGAPAFVLQNCIWPALPRFHQHYPDIELDLRIVNQVGEADGASIDVFVLLGWPDMPDHVQSRIAQARYVVLASPQYWATHEPVKRPADLALHQCFAFRNPRGVLLDFWEFERGEEKEAVKVRGWFSSNHRNLVIDAALAGEGVIRGADLVAMPMLNAGLLVPVLQDWNGLYAPPVSVAFRPKHRGTPRVRAVVDFIEDVFRRLEGERAEGRLAYAEPPAWYGRRFNRVSSAMS